MSLDPSSSSKQRSPRTQGRRSRGWALSVGLPVAFVLVVFVAGERYKSRDWLPWFLDQRTPLASVDETVLEEHPRHRLLFLILEGERPLRVTGHLKVPVGEVEPGSRPVLITLGGLNTGRDPIDYLDETGNWLILALDYPYEGPTRGVAKLEFVGLLPEMRRAMLETVPAGMLALDYLEQRDDVDDARIVVAGGSFGALFTPALAAADPRVTAAAIFFGAGDLPSLIEANLDLPWPAKPLVTWLGAVLVSPLEPLKYVHRVSPRPLFMLNGTEDEAMPETNSRVLHERAGEPKMVRWLPLGHVNVRAVEFHQQVLGECIDWLREIEFLSEDEAFTLAPQS